MAMSDEQVRTACGACLNALFANNNVVQPLERGTPREHVAWMLCKIPEFMASDRREKAMRWLGFVQGYLWASGLAGIDEMKVWNKPQPAFDSQ